MAESVIRRYDSSSARWHYEDGLMLKSIEHLWLATGDSRYFNFVKEAVDLFVGADGSI